MMRVFLSSVLNISMSVVCDLILIAPTIDVELIFLTIYFFSI